MVDTKKYKNNLTIKHRTMDNFTCDTCGEAFQTKQNLNIHYQYCISVGRCKWLYMTGKRCSSTAKYMGKFCKRHFLGNYQYDPNGIHSEGTREGCSGVYVRKINAISIGIVEKYSQYDFIGRGGLRYQYYESGNTYVKMKITQTGETVLFWRDSVARGKKPGQLLTTLVTEPFEDYCENLALCKIDEQYYCEECFAREFGGMVKSLA
jgi:hypothetical protein